MYILDISKMRPGDIILTAQSAARSKFIRKVTGSDHSHAMLYVRRGSYIHSDGNGVHSGNTQRLIFEDEHQAKVLRMESCPADAIEKVCEYARNKVGTQYSVPQAIKSAALRGTIAEGDQNRQFCSRLVAQAYEYGGMPLVKNADYCYPEDLARCPEASEVPNCVRLASAEEMEFAASDNPLELQAEITNNILKEARRIFEKDIQTLGQITTELLQRPEKDGQMFEVYVSSGYIEIWKIDTIKNRWRYDGAIFIDLPIPRPDLEDLAKQELISAKEQGKQFEIMLNTYQDLLQKQNLDYIKVNISLYSKLLELTLIRAQAASYVLDNA